MAFTVTGIVFFVFCVFVICALGYGLGRIAIKGISLGTAGVFIVALLFGCFFYQELSAQLSVQTLVDGQTVRVEFAADALKIIENIGLMFFVTAVGFISGPSFVYNLRKNYKSYVLIGLIIVLSGALVTLGCDLIGRRFSDLSSQEHNAMMAGLMAGALSSTPAFSAAKSALANTNLESLVTVGYGITYLFGVVGVVLFVQLAPKVSKTDMAAEREKLGVSGDFQPRREYSGRIIETDHFKMMPLAVAILLGVALGNLKFGSFSLTTTGGCLLTGLAFGHLGRIGPFNLRPTNTTLKALQELGLVFFLIGAGVAGGSKFLEYFNIIYFVYGVIITTVPMFVGYFFAKYVLKLSFLNNLGSITGGMTSTPALGTLIHVSKTDEVASPYAATYPIALIVLVLATQFFILFFG